MIDKDPAIGIFNENKGAGITNFINFHNELNEDRYLKIQDKEKKITDKELIEVIHRKYAINVKDIPNEPRGKRKAILRKLLGIQGGLYKAVSESYRCVGECYLEIVTKGGSSNSSLCSLWNRRRLK